MLYDRLDKSRVHCALCAHRCIIPDKGRGQCGVRVNQGGTLYTTVYGRVVSRSVDPIEKKPLFHFLPGSRAYSIATVGCNFTCLNCQNHTISQYPREHAGRVLGEDVPPEEVVAAAVESGCETIAYTYTEPTVFLEYALDTARLAHEEGLRNVFVSNGYMTEEALDEIVPYLDGINVDLKGISESFYRKVIGGNLRPVLRSIERLIQEGIWVEVTTLVIPDLNDSPESLRWTAEAIAGISPAVPWHLSRFYPAFRMLDHRPTPIASLREGQRVGCEAGLRYVYMGNIPGEGEDTLCPACGALVVRRRGFLVWENRLQEGNCPTCGAPLDGVWFSSP
jgi:pyruvate formate lyase activating enzyme